MIDARRPTTNGAIIDGKTTMSRSGTSGSWTMLGSGLDIFESVIRRFREKNFPRARGAAGFSPPKMKTAGESPPLHRDEEVAYPAFLYAVIGWLRLSTTSRVITHSLMECSD